MTNASTAPPTPVAPSIPQTLVHLCAHIGATLTTNPLQPMWEGLLQYHVAHWFLEQGWTLMFGEPGGDNRNAVHVGLHAGQYSQLKTKQDLNGSIDLIAGKQSTVLPLQLKTYPAIGRKSSRAGMESGLKKDLDSVAAGNAAFLFVADPDAYRSIRGERRGAAGPTMRWHLALPALDQVQPLDPTQPVGSQLILCRVGAGTFERIVCVLWQVSHADLWRSGPPA